MDRITRRPRASAGNHAIGESNMQRFHEWFESKYADHQRLAVAATSLVQTVLRRKGIPYLNVTARTKTAESAAAKYKKTCYANLDREFTDLTGIRIIGYLPKDIRAACEAIREAFEVDEENTSDRSTSLGVDRIGYRSIHFVCTLGTHRHPLPEYEGLSELKFEVQIRTVLQHAWAELAHDRSYKLGRALPLELQRKLNLYAGLLEIADAGFETVAHEINAYRSSIEERGMRQLHSRGIDEFSLGAYVNSLEINHEVVASDESDDEFEVEKDMNTILAYELRAFGLRTVGEIEKLYTKQLKRDLAVRTKPYKAAGLLRTMLMHNDIHRYFRKCRPDWTIMDHDTFRILSQKYGGARLLDILKQNGAFAIDDHGQVMDNDAL
ncbi:GTP pyrophosphokinase [Marinimicrococcus flavescens]|uniref:RelA/SpoT domain-containing protein n=1 Tax=Marinimicrococcus flavescens TaxID=3031815 RepID=A0AAP3XRW9_9PROT|nr:hypothetical protein [Marinimicrococcus flavescens]